MGRNWEESEGLSCGCDGTVVGTNSNSKTVSSSLSRLMISYRKVGARILASRMSLPVQYLLHVSKWLGKLI